MLFRLWASVPALSAAIIFGTLAVGLTPVIAQHTLPLSHSERSLHCSKRLEANLTSPSLSFTRPWTDERSFFASFEPFDRILMLADGNTAFESRQLAKRFPQKQITGTNLTILNSWEPLVGDLAMSPNLRLAEVDNTKPFPFADDQFDLVFMKSGLCTCRDEARCCGGIILEAESIRAFLLEVARVLDQRNPTAMAFLHGPRQSKKTVQLWLTVARESEALQAFQLEALPGPSGEVFAFRLLNRSVSENP